MKFNNFSSTPGRVMVHIGLVLVQWFKRSPCGPVMKLPLLFFVFTKVHRYKIDQNRIYSMPPCVVLLGVS